MPRRPKSNAIPPLGAQVPWLPLPPQAPDLNSDIPDDGFQLPPPAHNYVPNEYMHIDFRAAPRTILRPLGQLPNGDCIIHMTTRSYTSRPTSVASSTLQLDESDSESGSESPPSYPASESSQALQQGPPSWYEAEAQAIVEMHTRPRPQVNDSDAYTRWLARRRGDGPLLEQSWEAHSSRMRTLDVNQGREEQRAEDERRSREWLFVRVWKRTSAQDKMYMLLLVFLVISGVWSCVSGLLELHNDAPDR